MVLFMVQFDSLLQIKHNSLSKGTFCTTFKTVLGSACCLTVFSNFPAVISAALFIMNTCHSEQVGFSVLLQGTLTRFMVT